MDTADKFVNNKAPRRLLVMFLLLVTLSTLCGLFVSARIADKLEKQRIREMLSAASGEADLKNEPTAENIAAGEAIYSKNGITADMDPRLLRSWGDTRRTIFIVIEAFSCSVCIIWLIGSMRSVLGIYSDIEDIRQQCMKLAEDAEFAIEPRGEAFGCIRRVYDGIDVISKRMNHLNRSLAAEKSFLGEFLTDFSHQLKTSIAVIRLNSDIISESENISPEKCRRLFDEISDNISSMEKLTISALKLAKLNAEAIDYRMEPCDLTETCSAAIRRIRPLLREQDIDISLETGEADMTMSHDKIWLSEAVENIIKNAADHSGCSNITVSLSRTPVSVIIAIEDNGSGIPQEDIPRLFERFGKKSGSSSMNSVGIGISISKKIVEAHDGDIIVYSENGRGTRFEMVFLQ